MEIYISNLKKSYGQNVIFNGISLSISDNGVTCLFGSSGSGKTTLINIIGQIEEYDSGKIVYDNKEITNKDRKAFLREKVGFIFQNFGLLENETVYENMMMVYKIKKLKNPRRVINEMLKRFNLEDMIDRPVYELSGGEQQRVAIAKVFLKDPDLVLADEPTASLDDDNKDIVLAMIDELRRSGKTIIIVSHDKKIRDFCDVAIDIEDLKWKLSYLY